MNSQDAGIFSSTTEALEQVSDTVHAKVESGELPNSAVLELEVRAIHEKHSRSISAFARAFARDAEIAEEAMQEAYHRYLQARSGGVEITHPQAWLLRVIHNLVVDQRKAQWRNCELKASLPAPAIVDYGERESWLGEVLIRARHLLSRREQQVIDLRLRGLSYSEVARTLGIGSGSVSSLLNRACRKLREAKEHLEW